MHILHTRQSIYHRLTPRDSICSIIDRTDLNSKEALRWFPDELLKSCEYDKQKLQRYYLDGKPYIFTNYGSGQFRIDTIAQKLKTPNDDTASIQTWINMLDGDDRKFATSLLIRYTNLFLRGSKAWKEWFDKNRANICFSDKEGYLFYVKQN